MKKYILLTIGFEKPTPEIMDSWMKWFGSIKENTIEQVGLMNGKEVTPSGVTSLDMGLDAITGYLVVEAENMDEAIAMAKGCPMITSTRVYEVR